MKKMCFTRVFHWGPLTALSIIKFITFTTVYCNNLYWHPLTSKVGLLNTALFYTFAGLTLYHFLCAMYTGPGYLPRKWVPPPPAHPHTIPILQHCASCRGFKAPRAHHCRKCHRCVLKMDHHCPWINNCVGWANHGHFVAFLGAATVGSAHASGVLIACLVETLTRARYAIRGTAPTVPGLGLYGVILGILALGFAIGVVIAVGLLLVFQLRAILKNQTAVEDWIIEKANYRRRINNEEPFKFPYAFNKWENLRQVVNWTCTPAGDGVTYDIIEGCDLYTLTREQIEQKKEKSNRTKIYKVIRATSGAWFPITFGFKVFFCPPCTDEPRIKLSVGDHVSVTRWRNNWLFGQKIQCHSDDDRYDFEQRIRGWFPRQAAIEDSEYKKKTN